MKRLILLGAIAGCVVLLLSTTSTTDYIAHFVIAGHIPFTGLSAPPLLMLTFWIVIAPAVLLIRQTGNELLWRIIESIGQFNQRQINHSIRWTTRSESLLLLGAVTLLYIAEQLEDESTIPIGTLFSRRALSTTA